MLGAEATGTQGGLTHVVRRRQAYAIGRDNPKPGPPGCHAEQQRQSHTASAWRRRSEIATTSTPSSWVARLVMAVESSVTLSLIRGTVIARVRAASLPAQSVSALS